MRLPPAGHHLSPSRWPVLLILVATISGSDGQTCKTFSEALQDGNSYMCDPTCLDQNSLKTKTVYGTEYYSEDSDVCVAGVHAGRLGEEGGQLTFTHHQTHNNTFKGTIRNRVVSKSKSVGESAVFSLREAPQVITESDLARDVVVVHDSYSDGQNLHFSCLADNIRKLTKDDILSWNYNIYDMPSHIVDETKTKGTPKCVFPRSYNGKEHFGCIPGNRGPWCRTAITGDDWDRCTDKTGKSDVYMEVGITNNARVLRCRGQSAATDVMAVIQRPDQMYTSPVSTFRTHQGQSLSVSVTKKEESMSSNVYLKRLPDSWSYSENSYPDTSLPLTIENVSLADAGIYILGNSGTQSTFSKAKIAVEGRGAIFQVIVQECEPGRYGVRCEDWCPDCENGGLCHPQTGSCICAPGFRGDTCQIACAQGYFGGNCGLKCSKTSLHFSPQTEGSCVGLMVCLPEPYGCSCVSGYEGPLCKKECSRGWSGAGCSQRCDHCVGRNCDPLTRQCYRRCVAGVPCDENGLLLDLPRLRTPPTITNVTQDSAYLTFMGWRADVDDGSRDFAITEYHVQMSSEVNTTWTTLRNIPHDAGSPNMKEPVKVEGLIPGYQYTVRVLVQTDRGAADGSSKKRVQSTSFRTLCTDPEVSNLTVSNITNQSAILQWEGKDLWCEGTYRVVVTAAANRSNIYDDYTTNLTLSLTDLQSDSQYEARVVLPSRTEVSLLFSTHPNAPASPSVTVEQIGATTLSLSVTLPPDSDHADVYNVQYKLLNYIACNDNVTTEMDEEMYVQINVTTEMDEEMNESNSSVQLEKLQEYSTYEVCVQATNRGGSSNSSCLELNTLSDIPNINVTGLECATSSRSTTTCVAQLSGGCQDYNGPNIELGIHAETYLECMSSYPDFTMSQNSFNNTANFTIMSELPAGQMFTAAVYAHNDEGPGQTFNTNFSTPENRPMAVRNLTAVILSQTKVRLQWNDPCPPNGIITRAAYGYKLSREGLNNISSWTYKNSTAVPCEFPRNYDRCVEIDQLTPNEDYEYQVWAAVGNINYTFGPETNGTFTVKESEPGRPSLSTIGREASSLSLTLQVPEVPGGVLLSCTVAIPALNKRERVSLNPRDTQKLFQLRDLHHSQVYDVEMSCCNSFACGEVLRTKVATLLMPPVLLGDLSVTATTKSSITIALPTFEQGGQANRSMVVMVQRVSKKDINSVHENFTSEYLRLHDAGVAEKEDIYIAAIIKQKSMLDKFVVGDGLSWGAYHNYPLTLHQHYMVAVVAQTQLQGKERYSEMKLDDVVELGVNSGVNLPLLVALIIITILLIIMVGLVCHFRKKCLGKSAKENIVTGHYSPDNDAVHIYDNPSPVAPADNPSPDAPADNPSPDAPADNPAPDAPAVAIVTTPPSPQA